MRSSTTRGAARLAAWVHAVCLLAGAGGAALAQPGGVAADAPDAATAAAPSTARPAPAMPALAEPALRSPKAPHAATLAVTRAGPRLVAVGERGTVLLSDDRGARWRQATAVPVRTTLTAVRFVDARLGWAVGHQGVILHSRDGGETWTRQLDGLQAAALIAEAAQGGDERTRREAQRFIEEGPDKPFFDVDFADARRGWAVGAYNLAFRTEDGGASWLPMGASLPNPGARHLYGVRARDTRLVVAGEQGLLLRSDDGGLRFATLPSPYKGSFFGLLQARSGTLIAYGLRGQAYRSTDGGTQWDKVETGLQVAIAAGSELHDGTLALLGQQGQVITSHDDGRRFAPAAAPVQPLPSAGLAAAGDDRWVLATLRGTQRADAR